MPQFQPLSLIRAATTKAPRHRWRRCSEAWAPVGILQWFLPKRRAAWDLAPGLCPVICSIPISKAWAPLMPAQPMPGQKSIFRGQAGSPSTQRTAVWVEAILYLSPWRAISARLFPYLEALSGAPTPSRVWLWKLSSHSVDPIKDRSRSRSNARSLDWRAVLKRAIMMKAASPIPAITARATEIKSTETVARGPVPWRTSPRGLEVGKAPQCWWACHVRWDRLPETTCSTA